GEWTLSLVDKIDGDVGACVGADGWIIDVPELQEISGVSQFSCNLFTAVGACADGIVNPEILEEFELSFLLERTDDSGLTATEACCACGGGSPATAFTETLFGWTLEVYGASAGEETADPTVTVPPTNGTVPPTAPPSGGEAGCSSISTYGFLFATVHMMRSSVDVICGTESLSVLCDALQLTTVAKSFEVEIEITTSGLYTVFAPSDAAFDLAAIDFQSEAFDATILLSHITNGILFQDDLPCESPVNLLDMMSGITRVICTDDVPSHIQGPGNAIDAMPAFVETDLTACK
ncbi:MAG: hypothetical protein SGARI_006582, partial [Bacillariaceae sp.]